MFSRARDTPAPHKALMKGITDNECVAAMIGDVKVSVAGLAQATQVRDCLVCGVVGGLYESYEGQRSGDAWRTGTIIRGGGPV